MNEDRATKTGEIKLDPSKLLGFQTLATLGADAADLRRMLDDTHTKIGTPETVVPEEIPTSL